MDTSGLASSLSLVGFLLAYTYLSLVEHSVPHMGPWGHATTFSFARHLRSAVLVGIALSTLAVLHSQDSSAVWLIAVAAIALLAFLALIDRGALFLSRHYPRVTTALRGPFIRIFMTSRTRESQPADSEAVAINRHNGDVPEDTDATTVVITEEGQASLDARERLMIRSILRLDETTAKEIMVPRVDIVAVDAETPLTELAGLMLQQGHSRIPVFRESIDNIVGIVHSRDLLPFLGEIGEHPPLEQIMRPAFFTPETKRLDELLMELQVERVQMALVVDEYGGIEGLVTLEDLLEEIVGEIEDEFSRTHEPAVVPLANGDIIVDSRVTLDYLSDLFSSPIRHEDVDTVGGLVYSSLGKMPQMGDEVVHDGLRIEVVSLLGRRIRKLKLSRTGKHSEP